MSPAAALALLLKKLRREVDVGFLLVIFVVLWAVKNKLFIFLEPLLRSVEDKKSWPY